MEVKCQQHFDNDRFFHDHRQWTSSPSYHVDQKIEIISSPVRKKPPIPKSPARQDYLLRDKVKLLQLADRIETKKTSSVYAHIHSETSLFPTTPRRWSDDSIPEPEPIFQKVGSSFRRSKLYASFSPKRRSLNKLVKTDPAKTNIEHLVNRTGEPRPLFEVNDLQFAQNELSFHDGVRLATIFRSRNSESENFKGQAGLISKKYITPRPSLEDGESVTPKCPLMLTRDDEEGGGVKRSFEKDLNFAPIHSEPEQSSNCVGIKRNHDSLTSSLSHNSYLGQFEQTKEDLQHRKRSQSIPRSFQNEPRKNSNLQNQQETFWNEVGSEKIKEIEVRRMNQDQPSSTTRVEQHGLIQQSTSTVRRNSEASKQEGRPMSLDYGQRKAWLKAIGEMDLAQTPTAEGSQKVKKSSKPKGPISITHLHLTETELAEETEDSSSVGSAKSITPSIFQRFSKTFSLRFGSTTPKSTKTGPTGSSPDITHLSSGSTELPETPRKKTKKKVDPSSGKVRKRSITVHRDDKCQSGDSGIQLTEDRLSAEPELTNPAISLAISMKKLSLVQIADDGFVSDDDDGGESYRKRTNSKSFHSLPLKYSRQRKAELVIEKKALMRGNVIQELLTTEANYVKSLSDIVQGFVIPCRARTDLFNDKIVTNIFSNVEDILRLHARILESLQSCAAEGNPSEVRIGHIFIEWAPHLDLYSEYCYQSPMSMATVKQLCVNREYSEFFEACRRLQLMDKLPLHGFLLRPIQRICQYHLQLSELLKHTPPSHEDYADVEAALKTMKDVAMRMNDTQRKFDSLQEIVRLQSSIEGWEGEDLVPGSSVIFVKGDLIKTSPGHKPKEVYVILLNNELIITRKDYLKKGTISFWARIPLRSRWWVDIKDEDEYFGSVQNSWRIFSPADSTWNLLTAPSPAEKTKWMKNFESTNQSFQVDLKMSEMAKFTALKLMLAESQTQQSVISPGGTLPRLRKNRKNNSSLTKSDSDAMLIEVGKLRQPTNYARYIQRGFSTESTSSGQSQIPTSKFYI